MLPGIGGLVGKIAKGAVYTEFFKTIGTSSIIVPASVARLTMFAPSPYGNYTGGGACSWSVLALVEGETLTLDLNDNYRNGGGYVCTLKRGQTVLLAAQAGYNGAGDVNREGGKAINGVGQYRYSGGNTDTENLTYSGGAAGTLGNANGMDRGPGATFIQTSNGETATNGSGRPSSSPGPGYNYGGGSFGSQNSGGAGILIAEWGTS